MPKSTIPFLPISLLLLASCASSPVKDLTPTAVESAVYQTPYFSDAQTDYVYKAHILAYGNELGGVFIVKCIGADAHRVVFTTEFGNKLLDFEIYEADYKVKSVVEELDRKVLINTLVADFRLLLRENYAITRQFDTGSDKIFEAIDGQGFDYLYISKPGAKLTQIKHATKRKEKISIAFQSENNIFAESITIRHHNMPLEIVLNHFKNQ